MSSENAVKTTESSAAPAPAEPAAALGSHYGTCGGKTAYARETTLGSWQVKVHDPINRLSGHDGWLMLGTGWATLAEARTATGMS